MVWFNYGYIKGIQKPEMIIFFPFGGDWLIFTHTYTKFVQRIILVLSFDTSCTSLWHCDPDLQRNAEKREIAMVLLGGRNLKPCHSSKDAQTIINIICPHIHILCDEIYRVWALSIVIMVQCHFMCQTIIVHAKSPSSCARALPLLVF